MSGAVRAVHTRKACRGRPGVVLYCVVDWRMVLTGSAWSYLAADASLPLILNP